MVHQQEPAVQQINQGAEETHRNVEQANTKLDSAIQSAKNARRWKWYALIIVSKLIVYLVYISTKEPPANPPSQSLSSPLLSVWLSVSPRPTRLRTRTDQTLYDPRRGLTHHPLCCSFISLLSPLVVIPPFCIFFSLV